MSGLKKRFGPGYIFEIFLLLLVALSLAAGGCVDSGCAEPESSGVDTGTGNLGYFSGADEMKTIGVIGGISWVSSLEYYRMMNEMANERLGGLHSAEILMCSVEFGNFSKQERLAEDGDWGPLRNTMVEAAKRLEAGGADFIIICSNTMHSTAGDIEDNVDIPVLHIADATGERIKEKGVKTVGLLGRKYTMEESFYRDILEDKYGIEVIVPDESDRDYVNSVIFDELCAGIITDESRAGFVEIIGRLEEEGAEGVILGCTEIPLLVSQEDVDIAVFDTMTIHAQAAVDYAINKG
ncbi:aspartate/glutamate racemase family protein [Methanoplanus endosymbiosus]|uniref:Aspartate/glutamate racemase family protein n=1 Tax=Methanoplanus endosymbiosus TaxID=33865 RepID=A0A9E7PT09_9EURY|nr:aspartate/glutamate racemase family protein [Methanoplanus endosymbiosus]UUX93292.1 aspartate/glutamate racemase family protein [Methanoplanus endosymbiosus]